VNVYENREGVYQVQQDEIKQLTAERKGVEAPEGESTGRNDTGWWRERVEALKQVWPRKGESV
jgi:hypothetical protein